MHSIMLLQYIPHSEMEDRMRLCCEVMVNVCVCDLSLIKKPGEVVALSCELFNRGMWLLLWSTNNQ